MADEHNEEELVSMSLGDHLEELRARLILALTGLTAAFWSRWSRAGGFWR